MSLIPFLNLSFLTWSYGQFLRFVFHYLFSWSNWLSTCNVNFCIILIYISIVFSFLWIFFLQSETDPNTAYLIVSLFFTAWSFGLMFFYCQLGEMMITHQFELFDDKLCQCKWYLFRIEMQKMLVIFMTDTQQSIFIRGYGDIRCTRATFKQVIFDVNICCGKYFILFYFIQF